MSFSDGRRPVHGAKANPLFYFDFTDMNEPSENTRVRIRKLSRNHRDKVSAYRRELCRKLEAECIAAGGHFYWPERTHVREMVSQVIEDTVQICSCCNSKKTVSSKTLFEKF